MLYLCGFISDNYVMEPIMSDLICWEKESNVLMFLGGPLYSASTCVRWKFADLMTVNAVCLYQDTSCDLLEMIGLDPQKTQMIMVILVYESTLSLVFITMKSSQFLFSLNRPSGKTWLQGLSVVSRTENQPLFFFFFCPLFFWDWLSSVHCTKECIWKVNSMNSPRELSVSCHFFQINVFRYLNII